MVKTYLFPYRKLCSQALKYRVSDSSKSQWGWVDYRLLIVWQCLHERRISLCSCILRTEWDFESWRSYILSEAPEVRAFELYLADHRVGRVTREILAIANQRSVTAECVEVNYSLHGEIKGLSLLRHPFQQKYARDLDFGWGFSKSSSFCGSTFVCPCTNRFCWSCSRFVCGI